MINKIPSKHILGKEYFRLTDLESLENNRYFDCIDFLRPLFHNSDFQKSTPGFYLNWITNRVEDGDDGKNSVRLTYFTISPLKTIGVIKNFEKENVDKIKIYDSKTKERPIGKDLINFDEKQNRFWQFLNDYTQIGLDLLKNLGRDCTRKLIADYRLNYFPLPNPKIYFEAIFNQYSDYLRQLNKDNFVQNLWEDLQKIDDNGVWMHLMVNMLLPGDYSENGIAIYGKPILADDGKKLLDRLGLNLLDNWKLNCNLESNP